MTTVRASSCLARKSEAAERRPRVEPSPPIGVGDDVIVTADGVELPPIEKLADATAPCDRPVGRAEWVELHADAIEENVVADEQRLLEDVESEAGGMAVDVEGLDSVVAEIPVEHVVKVERAADFMARIGLVDGHPGAKLLPVEVGGTEKVVMGEQDRVDTRQRFIEGGGAVDPAGALAGFDPIGGMLETERRLGVELRHLLVDRGGNHPEAG